MLPFFFQLSLLVRHWPILIILCAGVQRAQYLLASNESITNVVSALICPTNGFGIDMNVIPSSILSRRGILDPPSPSMSSSLFSEIPQNSETLQIQELFDPQAVLWEWLERKMRGHLPTSNRRETRTSHFEDSPHRQVWSDEEVKELEMRMKTVNRFRHIPMYIHWSPHCNMLFPACAWL